MMEPFRISVPQDDLDDLHERLRRTRWPEPETVADWSQGVPLRYLRELCDHWRQDYDWRATESRINRLPQIRTRIDGLDVHAVHVRASDPDALPLLLTHGWPGSFLEFEKLIGLLRDDFHLVIPSLPGYGFSGRPTEPGWGIRRIADAWAVLMERLGYRRFAAAGSDWGTSISTVLAQRHPDRVAALHLIPPLVAPLPGEQTEAERAGLAELARRQQQESGYSAIQASKPQTIGYGLLDSPTALCAWLVEKYWAWADHDGDLDAVISRREVLDVVSLYWLTGTGASAARLYWESIAEVSAWFSTGGGGVASVPVIDVPTGATVFPREVPRPSRRWAQARFPDLRHWGEPARGGHFGALEQPAILAAELRTLLRNQGSGG
jgi:pimeloyl-ACP methyl ester carboxylesterase